MRAEKLRIWSTKLHKNTEQWGMALICNHRLEMEEVPIVTLFQTQYLLAF